MKEEKRTIINVGLEELPEIKRSELQLALNRMKNRKALGKDRNAENLRVIQ